MIPRFLSTVVCVVGIGIGPCKAADLNFVTHEFPPYSYEAHGVAVGPLVDVVMGVCEEIGRSCSIKILPWRRAIDGLEAGAADGIFPVLPNSERREKYTLSPSIVKIYYGFYSRSERNWTYSDATSLEGKTVAVFGPSGTSSEAEGLVRQTKTARIEVEVSNEVMLHKLAEERYGRDGVGFINLDVARDIIKRTGYDTLREAGTATVLTYAIAFSRSSKVSKDTELFNDRVKKSKLNGSIKRILSQYGLQQAD